MKLCPSCKSEFGGGEIFCPNDGARLVTPSQFSGISSGDTLPGNDPLVGMILSERYKILRQIGEGGMGLVYEAEHVAIEKRVALKVLRDDFSNRPEVVERFKQEAKSASRIGNEHIVDISDFGVTPSGASYFVMELLEGEDLANVLSREVQLPIARAADILLQCCKALGAAHAKGIVHRDMKPENIFLTERGARADFVKIVDFGIAKMSDIEVQGAPGRKLTKTGMIFGTPEYMSPEQAAGKSLDHRVDIYALAVIFFEMITGRVPFIGDTFMGILTQHMFEDPPRIDEINPRVEVPPAILSFLARGLAKDPDDRFQACDEMARELEAAMAGRISLTHTYPGYGEPVAGTARAPRAMAPASANELPVVQRSRTGLVLGAAVVLIAALAGGTTVWYIGSNTEARDHDEDLVQNHPVDAPAVVEEDGGAIAIAEGPRIPDAGGPPVASDAGPEMVNISVQTTPSGSRVFVEGIGTVCEATPCSFATAMGREIVVRARNGRSSGETRLTPEANTLVQLEMRPDRPTGPPRTKNQNNGTQQQNGSGDLKIPDIFRSPR
jgi:eukaryotic-like serine/threonine-protein kinase